MVHTFPAPEVGYNPHTISYYNKCINKCPIHSIFTIMEKILINPEILNCEIFNTITNNVAYYLFAILGTPPFWEPFCNFNDIKPNFQLKGEIWRSVGLSYQQIIDKFETKWNYYTLLVKLKLINSWLTDMEYCSNIYNKGDIYNKCKLDESRTQSQIKHMYESFTMESHSMYTNIINKLKLSHNCKCCLVYDYENLMIEYQIINPIKIEKIILKYLGLNYMAFSYGLNNIFKQLHNLSIKYMNLSTLSVEDLPKKVRYKAYNYFQINTEQVYLYYYNEIFFTNEIGIYKNNTQYIIYIIKCPNVCFICDGKNYNTAIKKRNNTFIVETIERPLENDILLCDKCIYNNAQELGIDISHVPTHEINYKTNLNSESQIVLDINDGQRKNVPITTLYQDIRVYNYNDDFRWMEKSAYTVALASLPQEASRDRYQCRDHKKDYSRVITHRKRIVNKCILLFCALNDYSSILSLSNCDILKQITNIVYWHNDNMFIDIIYDMPKDDNIIYYSTFRK